jgi:hypothetical protein
VHGLEAPFHDQSESVIAWSTKTDAYAGGSSPLPTAIGTGSANTDSIIAQNGGLASAAKLCADYQIEGFTDWYLPSYDELHQLYIQRGIFVTDYYSPFSTDGSYWSSSEGSETDWVLGYYFGGTDSTAPYIGSKAADVNHVRAVRAF